MADDAVEIFFSFVTEEKDFYHQIRQQLSLLERNGRVHCWSSEDIQAGADQVREIRQLLDRVTIVAPLISPTYLASDEHYQELVYAMTRHSAGEIHVVPVLLKPGVYRDAPFAGLRTLPTDGETLTTCSSRDKTLSEIAVSIEKLLSQSFPSASTMNRRQHWMPPYPYNTLLKERFPFCKNWIVGIFISVLVLAFLLVINTQYIIPEPGSAIFIPFFIGFTGLSIVVFIIQVRRKKVEQLLIPLASPTSPSTHTNQQQSLPVSTGSIFLANAPLLNTDAFFNRELEKTQLLRNTRHGGSTSIVGPRRIGKTWLISYLRLVAPVELGSNYHIGYLDVTSPNSRTRSGFTIRALEVLGYDTTLLNHSRVGLGTLEKFLEELNAHYQIPVLCIDEFDGLNNRSEFDRQFFEGLRALTQERLLILVTASRKSLKDILVDTLGETSPFFNVFYPISLHPFDLTEARNFAETKGVQAGFSKEECIRLLEYSLVNGSHGEEQWPPFRLQLVGQMMLDEKNAARINPNLYRPDDIKYWQDFRKRLEEHYWEMVQ